MAYDFYDLAKEQPDLNDVVDYLKRPILILEDIHTRIRKSSLNDKTDPNIIQINLDCDKIINRYFPELIENYCNLSIEYRNTSIIKDERKNGQNVKYTAKDLLIKNIATLTEEVLLLEESYNESHTRHLLVQNRLVSELGVHDSLLEMEKESPHKVQLENKFDYQAFKKINEDAFFKKEVKGDLVVKPTENTPPKSVIQEQANTHSGGGISLIELMLVFSFITMITAGIYTMYNNVSNTERSHESVLTLNQLNSGIRSLYANASNYNGLSTDLLISSSVVPPRLADGNNIVSPYGKVMVRPETTATPNDSFSIIFEHIPQQACVLMVASESPQFSKIEVNSNVLEGPISPSDAVQNCKEDNLISFIQR